jgi:hypothetical protein
VGEHVLRALKLDAQEPNLIRRKSTEELVALTQVEREPGGDRQPKRTQPEQRRPPGYVRDPLPERPDDPAGSQKHGQLQADRGLDQGCQPDRQRAPEAASRVLDDKPDRQPTERKRHQPIEEHRLEEMIRSDVSRFRRQGEADCDESDLRSGLGPDGAGQAVETEAGHDEGQHEEPRQCGREPGRSTRGVEKEERPPVRVEGVEGADERVVCEDRRVLAVEQQGKTVRLVGVAAMIAAQGEVKPQYQDERQPSG